MTTESLRSLTVKYQDLEESNGNLSSYHYSDYFFFIFLSLLLFYLNCTWFIDFVWWIWLHYSAICGWLIAFELTTFIRGWSKAMIHVWVFFRSPISVIILFLMLWKVLDKNVFWPTKFCFLLSVQYRRSLSLMIVSQFFPNYFIIFSSCDERGMWEKREYSAGWAGSN